MKKRFKCSSCGNIVPKWQGRCFECGKFNTYDEVQYKDTPIKKNRLSGYSDLSNKVSQLSEIRNNDFKIEVSSTGLETLDKVLSSNLGLVKGSVSLIGGDPGIGKSTLLLQLSGIFAGQGKKVLYISGEESEGQIALRSKRLGLTEKESESVYIANMSELEQIVNVISQEKPDFMIIDSIQTIYSSQLSSTPGSVSQIKECATLIAQQAKQQNIDTFLIGHVTKEGDIAGPQVLEHIVDTVLYFEGSEDSNYRTLKVHKNRYGNTNEIAIFEMTEQGLVEITDPSSIFIDNNYDQNEVGTVILATQSQNTALMIEIQSLIDQNNSQYAKRIANGIEFNRLAMILAIVNRISAIKMNQLDIFVNVISGFKINDASSDLAVFLSVLSSIQDQPIKKNTATFGEISLNGKLRLNKGFEKRINVASKTGFKHIIMPVIKDKDIVKRIKKNNPDIELIMCESVFEAFEKAFER